MPPITSPNYLAAMVTHMAADFLPLILFVIFAPAALGKWLELVLAALCRRIPMAVGLIGVAMMIFLGTLAWAAYFNWLQINAQFSQGRSLDDALAALAAAPQLVQLATPIPLWTKDGLALATFGLALVLIREGQRVSAAYSRD